jgi:hypothetical protein
VIALVAAGSAGGAYAASQSSSNPQQAYLNDVAKRLNVSPARLRSAMKGALIDALNAAVKRGELTRAEANRIEQRLERAGKFPPFPGPAAPFGLRARPFLIASGLDTAAKYLGLSEMQLLGDLRSGQSLAQVAKARGKSVSGLEQAIVSAETTRLNQLQSKGLITKAQEQRMLSRLSKVVSRIVNRSGFGRLRMFGPNGPRPQIAPVIPPPAGAVPAPALVPAPAPYGVPAPASVPPPAT